MTTPAIVLFGQSLIQQMPPSVITALHDRILTKTGADFTIINAAQGGTGMYAPPSFCWTQTGAGSPYAAMIAQCAGFDVKMFIVDDCQQDAVGSPVVTKNMIYSAYVDVYTRACNDLGKNAGDVPLLVSTISYDAVLARPCGPDVLQGQFLVSRDPWAHVVSLTYKYPKDSGGIHLADLGAQYALDLGDVAAAILDPIGIIVIPPPPPPPPPGTIGTPVSLGNGTTTGANVTSTSLNIGTAINAGDTIIATIKGQDLGTFTSHTLTVGGNTLTKVAGGPPQNQYQYLEFWICTNAVAVPSGTQMVLTHDATVGAGGGRILAARTITGLAASPVAQVAITNTGSATNPSVTTAALASTNAIIIGDVSFNNAVALGESTGFTTGSMTTAGANEGGGWAYKMPLDTSPVQYAPSCPGASLTNIAAIVFNGA